MVSVQSVKKVFVSFRACRGIPFYYCAFHGILRYAQHDKSQYVAGGRSGLRYSFHSIFLAYSLL